MISKCMRRTFAILHGQSFLQTIPHDRSRNAGACSRKLAILRMRTFCGSYRDASRVEVASFHVGQNSILNRRDTDRRAGDSIRPTRRIRQ